MIEAINPVGQWVSLPGVPSESLVIACLTRSGDEPRPSRPRFVRQAFPSAGQELQRHLETMSRETQDLLLLVGPHYRRTSYLIRPTVRQPDDIPPTA
ncbi:hypothetical protein [Amycolatopsis sp. WQ 127309]|uniref:hypothetical protein n=1 Tax=Amycolatopsis sp. WQ 127309 TaxID=2932773 RepID=UPI001FF2815A|nr:hypothetical protein [Amycolatopsis sp. WQ 127309]UOZ11351.1 hypothetical protein MUY22_25015 [Amycolatopsis sp. WQ 127309]